MSSLCFPPWVTQQENSHLSSRRVLATHLLGRCPDLGLPGSGTVRTSVWYGGPGPWRLSAARMDSSSWPCLRSKESTRFALRRVTKAEMRAAVERAPAEPPCWESRTTCPIALSLCVPAGTWGTGWGCQSGRVSTAHRKVCWKCPQRSLLPAWPLGTQLPWGKGNPRVASSRPVPALCSWTCRGSS